MLALTLHPSELRKPRHSVRAKLRSAPLDSGKLLLVYEVQGAGSVQWPNPVVGNLATGDFAKGERRDELWKSTCFECFLGPLAKPNYVEWNFSASGDWAAYAFTAYRSGMANAEVSAPVIHLPVSKSDAKVLEVEVDVPEELRAAVASDLSRIQVSLTAVIVEAGEEKPFYWAIGHWREKPDFHARESFTLLP